MNKKIVIFFMLIFTTFSIAYASELEDAKINAKSKIQSTYYFYDEQKKALKSKVDEANDIDAVNQILQLVDDLISPSKQMYHTISKSNSVKYKVNFIDATQPKKDAFLKAQKELKDATSSIDIQNINEKIQLMNYAIDNLDGEAAFNAKKSEAILEIENAKYLEDYQKTYHKKQIGYASSISRIEAALDKMRSYDSAMKRIKDIIANHIIIINGDKYIYADDVKKTEYNNSYDKAYNSVSKDLYDYEYNKIADKVDSAVNNLDGVRLSNNIDDARQEVIEFVNLKTNLNSLQKQSYISEINNKTVVDEITKLKPIIASHDDSMKELKSLTGQDISNEKGYILSEIAEKTKYNNALDTALLKETENVSLDTVKQLIQEIKNSKENLSGYELINNVKLTVKNSSLYTKQKSELNQQIDDINTRDELNKLLENINNLNDIIVKYRKILNDSSSIKNKPAYKESSLSLKEDFDLKLKNANDNKESLDINLLNSLYAELNDAYQKLDGQPKYDKRLQEAINEINDSQNLKSYQKNYHINKVKNTTTVLEIESALNVMRRYDKAMEFLKSEIDEFEKIKNSITFENASKDKKDEYIKKVNEGISIYDKDKYDTEFELAAQAMKEARLLLDGKSANFDSIKSELLDNIENSNLSDKQKKRIIKSLNKTNNDINLENLKEEFNNLNNVMNNLSIKVKGYSKLVKSASFKNANKQSKLRYIELYRIAKEVFDNKKDPDIKTLISINDEIY